MVLPIDIPLHLLIDYIGGWQSHYFTRFTVQLGDLKRAINPTIICHNLLISKNAPMIVVESNFVEDAVLAVSQAKSQSDLRQSYQVILLLSSLSWLLV